MGITLVALDFTNIEMCSCDSRQYAVGCGGTISSQAEAQRSGSGGAQAVVSAVNAHAVGGDLEPVV
jgi:hypothetical protein